MSDTKYSKQFKRVKVIRKTPITGYEMYSTFMLVGVSELCLSSPTMEKLKHVFKWAAPSLDFNEHAVVRTIMIQRLQRKRK